MKVNEVPKYTSVETVMQLTKRQRQILYRHCINGRSCYLVDVNYGTGDFYENCFDNRGVFDGQFITRRYEQKELEESKRSS